MRALQPTGAHMNFAYTLVYVADVAASLVFFERAFGLPTRFLHESGAYGEVDTGGCANRDAMRAHLLEGAEVRALAEQVPENRDVLYLKALAERHSRLTAEALALLRSLWGASTRF